LNYYFSVHVALYAVAYTVSFLGFLSFVLVILLHNFKCLLAKINPITNDEYLQDLNLQLALIGWGCNLFPTILNSDLFTYPEFFVYTSSSEYIGFCVLHSS
jgi:hypothetical protein